MHILICDDDAAFGARIEECAAEFFRARSIPVHSERCTTFEQALETTDLELYQLAFLDVDLNEKSDKINGISLGKQLKQRNPNIILVYVSSYLEFAPQGYTVKAYRYILKRDVARQLADCLDSLMADLTDTHKVLRFRANRVEYEIPLDQIFYLESAGRQIDIYGDVAHQRTCSYYCKISELPAMLYDNDFVQISRSDVVNMKYIRQIRNYKVYLSNGVELGVSRQDYARIRAAWLEWRGQFGDE